MYINSGYRNHSLLNFKDKSRPLIVGSCGTYRLSTHPICQPTVPEGDWTSRSSMLPLDAPTSILTIRITTRLSMPETWYCSAQGNFRNMNTME